MAQESAVKNYKISERTIRSIEEGKKVKLSTAENYCTIIGCSVNELTKTLEDEDKNILEFDISDSQIL